MNNHLGISGFQPWSAEWQINKPPTYTNTFTGNLADVNLSASVYYNAGWNVKINQGNPASMVANISTELGSDGITPISTSGSFVTVNWSLHYKTTDKELLHVNSNVIPWIDQVSQADKLILENYISNPPKDGDISFTSSFQSTASAVIFNLSTTGFRTIPITTPIFRQTLVVPATYNLSSFNTNIARIYSVSSLSSNIGIPSNWSSIMPQGTDPDPGKSNGIPYLYGWLKNPPTQDQNGITINIQQEYEYGLYPQNIFGTRL